MYVADVFLTIGVIPSDSTDRFSAHLGSLPPNGPVLASGKRKVSDRNGNWAFTVHDERRTTPISVSLGNVLTVSLRVVRIRSRVFITQFCNLVNINRRDTASFLFRKKSISCKSIF